MTEARRMGALTCGVVGIMLLLKVYLPGRKWISSGRVAARESLCAADVTARPASGFSSPARAGSNQNRQAA